jgi:hypothetical protein
MPDTRIYLSTESEKDQFLADVEHVGWILEEQGYNMRAVNYPQRISRSEVLRHLVASFLEAHLQEDK